MENNLDKLIRLTAKLPGLGSRSARRAVLHLLKNREAIMQPLIEALQESYESIKSCEICANLDVDSLCSVCSDNRRDGTLLCVVEEVEDLWAFERGDIFNGKYHVLGGTLSAVDGKGPSDLNIESLLKRVSEGAIAEVIIATNATIDGQTTAHYITERLKGADVKITRLAHGIPIGGELDYLDEGTLSTALKARSSF